MPADWDYGVLLDDLTADAKIWRSVRDAVSNAKTQAVANCLEDFATDGLSYSAGFQSTYNEVQAQLVSFLGEGSIALGEVADNLDTTRTLYEASEEYAQWKLTH